MKYRQFIRADKHETVRTLNSEAAIPIPPVGCYVQVSATEFRIVDRITIDFPSEDNEIIYQTVIETK